jgi:hypothetical protein
MKITFGYYGFVYIFETPETRQLANLHTPSLHYQIYSTENGDLV